MALIKVKIPPFCTGQAYDQLCYVTVFVNNRCSLCCHSGSVAVFEAENTGIVSFLISDVCMHESLPFFRDLVISGILTPGRQYDMVLSGTTYDLKEIISESSSLA